MQTLLITKYHETNIQNRCLQNSKQQVNYCKRFCMHTNKFDQAINCPKEKNLDATKSSCCLFAVLVQRWLDVQCPAVSATVTCQVLYAAIPNQWLAAAFCKKRSSVLHVHKA